MVELVTLLSLPLKIYDFRECGTEEIEIRQSAQAFREPAKRLGSLPLFGHCLEAQRELLQVDSRHHSGKTLEA